MKKKLLCSIIFLKKFRIYKKNCFFAYIESSNNSMNMADPIKRISDSRTQQYWTSISSSISNTTNRLRVNIFNPPLPPNVVERTIEVYIRNYSFFFINK
jgi:hypothetical protein